MKSLSHSTGRQYNVLVFLVAVTLLLNCGKKNNESSGLDTVASVDSDTTLADAVSDDEYPRYDNSEDLSNTIQYGGTEDDQIKNALLTPPGFAKIHRLAMLTISLKDSLESHNEYKPANKPEDSLIFRPTEIAAYRAILDYKKELASRSTPASDAPSIIDLTRTLHPGDSSSQHLPKVDPSRFFSSGKFFFLGGAPFISKLNAPENSIFKDPEGKPEIRFVTTVPENARYLPASIMAYAPGPVDIEFGGPLDSYEMGPQEVEGIGSLIHHFVNRVPAFFVTEEGLVPAHLISMRLKLVDEGLGCISDQPLITFASSRNIAEQAILAVYIPYGPGSATSCTVERAGERVWVADLNADRVPDIGCVTGTFAGISDDTMAQCLWFINLDGTWQIIDFAEELDCT
ncbi:MAG TPA: hypothetical protein VEB86_07985 [Chryseosolibacter sp.]|nr:hypothetical protein [Chryseosolibacter sp.]